MIPVLGVAVCIVNNYKVSTLLNKQFFRKPKFMIFFERIQYMKFSVDEKDLLQSEYILQVINIFKLIFIILGMKYSQSQQYLAVAILGIAFMMMFTAYNSLQNMISSLYQQEGYRSLGQIALFGIYSAASIGHFATTYIISKMGYKKLMFICSLMYTVFQLTGLLVAKCKNLHTGICQKGFVYTIVILGSFCCGLGASCIWVAQGSYVSDLATQNNKTELFGLFWSLKSLSQIFGAIIATFVLGNLSTMTYFTILSCLGVVGALCFLLLKPIQQKKVSLSLKQGVKEIIQMIKEPNTFRLKLYYIFSGVSLACYSGFLYKLINRSIKQKIGQDKDEYNKQLKLHTGFVLIVLGTSLVTSGLIMNRIKQKINKYRMLVIGSVLVQCAAIVSLLTYFLQSYILCFLCAILWGVSDICLQANLTALVGISYPGKPAAYSVLRTFITLGIASFLLINIIFTEVGVPSYVFMLVVLGFQSIMTSLGNIQQTEDNLDKKSLVSSDSI